MQRYFVDKNNIKNNQVLLDEFETHHIKNVMRFKLGDQVIINTYEGEVFLTKIQEFSKKSVLLEIISKLVNDFEPLNLDIGVSLIKKDKLELVIQKLTELGVRKMLPLKTDYSIIKVDDFEKKKNRFMTISKEAAEQSERTNLLEIGDFIELDALDTSDYDYCFFGYAREEKNLIREVLKNLKISDKVLFLIGPEGGFSQKEIEWLKANKFISVSFGQSVLRAETAAIFVASVFKYLWGEQK